MKEKRHKSSPTIYFNIYIFSLWN